MKKNCTALLIITLLLCTLSVGFLSNNLLVSIDPKNLMANSGQRLYGNQKKTGINSAVKQTKAQLESASKFLSGQKGVFGVSSLMQKNLSGGGVTNIFNKLTGGGGGAAGIANMFGGKSGLTGILSGGRLQSMLGGKAGISNISGMLKDLPIQKLVSSSALEKFGISEGGNPIDMLGQVAAGGNPMGMLSQLAGGAGGGNPMGMLSQFAEGAKQMAGPGGPISTADYAKLLKTPKINLPKGVEMPKLTDAQKIALSDPKALAEVNKEMKKLSVEINLAEAKLEDANTHYDTMRQEDPQMDSYIILKGFYDEAIRKSKAGEECPECTVLSNIDLNSSQFRRENDFNMLKIEEHFLLNGGLARPRKHTTEDTHTKDQIPEKENTTTSSIHNYKSLINKFNNKIISWIIININTTYAIEYSNELLQNQSNIPYSNESFDQAREELNQPIWNQERMEENRRIIGESPLGQKEESATTDKQNASQEVQDQKNAAAAAAGAEKLIKMIIKLTDDTGIFDIRALQVGREASWTLVDASANETNVINRVIKLLAQVIGTISVLLMVIAGLIMVTSHGDETVLNRGKDMITYTTIGLVTGFLSYMIIQFLISFLFRVL